jgi:site-specific DNA recombinase
VVVATSAMSDDADLLTFWISQGRSANGQRHRSPDKAGDLRFAFYGRVSTADFQERESSRQWQRDVVDDLVAGHGQVVAEFFDVSRSRRLPWCNRPQAAVLLEALAEPDRGLDAVVVGEYERAFYGGLAPEGASPGTETPRGMLAWTDRRPSEGRCV